MPEVDTRGRSPLGPAPLPRAPRGAERRAAAVLPEVGAGRRFLNERAPCPRVNGGSHSQGPRQTRWLRNPPSGGQLSALRGHPGWGPGAEESGRRFKLLLDFLPNQRGSPADWAAGPLSTNGHQEMRAEHFK